MDSGSSTALARLPTILLLMLPVIFLHYFVIADLYDPDLHPKYFFLVIYLVLLGTIQSTR